MAFFPTLTPDPKSLKKALISRSFRYHFLQTKNMSVGIRQPRLFLSVTIVGVDITGLGVNGEVQEKRGYTNSDPYLRSQD